MIYSLLGLLLSSSNKEIDMVSHKYHLHVKSIEINKIGIWEVIVTLNKYCILMDKISIYRINWDSNQKNTVNR